MKLYWNEFTKTLSLQPGSQTSIRAIITKRETTEVIELVPTEADGTPKNFANGAEGVCVVKQVGAYTGPAKLLDAAWEPPQVNGDGYVFSWVVGGPALDEALGDSPFMVFALELVWDEAGKRTIAPTIEYMVHNNYYRSEDPPPPDPATPMPIFANILVKTEQELSDADQAQVRINLGIANSLFRNPVAVPADSDAPGNLGDYAFDAATGKLWVKPGAQWGFFRLNIAD